MGAVTVWRGLSIFWCEVGSGSMFPKESGCEAVRIWLAGRWLGLKSRLSLSAVSVATCVGRIAIVV